MRNIEEYTVVELAELSDEEVEELIKIELLKAGCSLSAEPEYPQSVTIPEPAPTATPDLFVVTKTDYSNNFTDIGFLSEDAAQAFLKLNPVVVSKEHDSQTWKAKLNCHISFAKIFNRNLATNEQRIAQELYKTKVAEYNEALEDYKKSIKEREKLIDKVYEPIRNARLNKAKATRILNTYNDYLAIAKNDKDIALGFMKANWASQISDVQPFLEGTDLWAQA